jgi:hypothetical protein
MRSLEGSQLAEEIEKVRKEGVAVVSNITLWRSDLNKATDCSTLVFVNCSINSCFIENSDAATIPAPIVYFADCHVANCRFDNASLMLEVGPFESLKFSQFTSVKKPAALEEVGSPNVVRDCSFVASNIKFANFHGTRISRCDFGSSDLSEAVGLEFDECFVDGARLPLPKAQEIGSNKFARMIEIWFGDGNYKWGALLVAYTGPSFYLLLLLSLSYLLPPALLLPLLYYVWPQAFSMTPVIEDDTSILVITLLLGWKGSITFDLVSRAVIWVYVILRAVQTIYASRFRHSQQITGRTPSLSVQRRLWSTHRVLRWLSLFVISYLVVQYASMLFSEIHVPKFLLSE